MKHMIAVLGAIIMTATCMVNAGMAMGMSVSAADTYVRIEPSDIVNTTDASTADVEYIRQAGCDITQSVRGYLDESVCNESGGQFISYDLFYGDNFTFAVGCDYTLDTTAEGKKRVIVTDMYAVVTDVVEGNTSDTLTIPKSIDVGLYKLASYFRVTEFGTGCCMFTETGAEVMDYDLTVYTTEAKDTLTVKKIVLSPGLWCSMSTNGVKTMNIPSTVTQVTTRNAVSSALGGTMLQYLVDESNAKYKSVNGALVDKTTDTLVAYPSRITSSRVTEIDGRKALVIDEASNIGDYAFTHLETEQIGVEMLVLDSNVKSVSSEAFKTLGRVDGLTTLRVTNPECKIMGFGDLPYYITSVESYGSGSVESEATNNGLGFIDITGDEPVAVTKYGDVNDDGEVNVSDIVAINMYNLASDTYELSAQGLANADVYKDGAINTSDSALLMNFVCMLVTEDKLGADTDVEASIEASTEDETDPDIIPGTFLPIV